jgi:tripartite-type tricarboxylate transporter receptor subunit TctC
MEKNKLFPQIIFLSFILLLILFFPLQSFSQDFPSKPIKLYVGYTPGASTDITARALATEAQRFLGVPVVVENKPGGSSSVAAALLAREKADGYTVAVIGSSALNTVHIMSKLSYDPFKDFTYLFSYGNYMAELAVRNDSPFKNFPDFIQYARNNPGKLSFGSAGVGSSGHMFTEYVAKEAKVQFKHVPFKGAVPAMTAMLGGHLDFYAGTGTHLRYVRQGLWRLLVIVHQETRDPEFPDVPTFTEFGYKPLPGGLADLTLIAPKNLPDSVYNKLVSGFTQAANAPKFQETLTKVDMPFTFKDRRKLETELPIAYKACAEMLEELGLGKKK